MTAQATYTIGEVQEFLGLSRLTVVNLIAAGFITPARGRRNEFRFTFQDVVVLRTAHRLTEENVPLRKVVQSLKVLIERLPAEMPMSGLRITAIGGEVAVRTADAQWEAPSGQVLIDFEVTADSESVRLIAHPSTDADPVDDSAVDTAEGHFRRGHNLEDEDPSAAEAAYRSALEFDATHTPSLLNLGALLCRHGHCDDAAELYERALREDPDNAALLFNLAIALEDQKRYASAIAAYERVLELAPDVVDAHYNVGLLYDITGEAQKALRHISAYKRLAG